MAQKSAKSAQAGRRYRNESSADFSVGDGGLRQEEYRANLVHKVKRERGSTMRPAETGQRALWTGLRGFVASKKPAWRFTRWALER